MRWTQKHPKAFTYKHMICAKHVEVHSDTGFRREENEEGEVDGKAIRGINIIRFGKESEPIQSGGNTISGLVKALGERQD